MLRAHSVGFCCWVGGMGRKQLSPGDSAAALGMLRGVALKVSLGVFGQPGFVLCSSRSVLWLELQFSLGHQFT